MVRYANRSKTGVSVPKGSTPCVTHHFPAGSLHAPYDLLSPLVIGKVMIKARPGQDIGPLFSKSARPLPTGWGLVPSAQCLLAGNSNGSWPPGIALSNIVRNCS